MQKIDASWTSILVDFFSILRANLVTKWREFGSPKRIDVGKPENIKKAPWLQPGLVFSDFFDASWHQKRFRNLSQNDINLGRHLGIDF